MASFALPLPVSPVDIAFVGAAGVIFIGAGLLQKSLGNVTKDVDNLPAASGARARRESQRSKRFLKRNSSSGGGSKE